MDESIKDVIIDKDEFLYNKFKEAKNNIEYIKRKTKTAIDKLDSYDNINYRTKEILELWKLLIGDAIIYLKKKDKREKHKDNMKLGLAKIYNYITKYKEFETIIYGVKHNYRDHIIHVFRTYLLGDYLIRNSFGYNNIDLQGISIITPSEKEAMWTIISLCHDLGYPLEVIHDINNPVRNILKTFGPISITEFGFNYFPQFSEISKFAINFMSSNIVTKIIEKEGKKEELYIAHIQPKYYQKFTSALSEYDHGVISGVLLMKDLVYFKESDYSLDEHKPLEKEDVRQFEIRRDIIRAISSHNCKDIYYLTGKSFSFLLKAFDEMQEWGRPRLVDITKRGGTESTLTINDFGNKIVDYKITFDYNESLKNSISPLEKSKSQEDIENYFKIKSGVWLNVLRSAVDSANRDLILKFTVKDATKDEPAEYSLTHIKPNDVKILPKKFKKKIFDDWSI